MVQDGDIVYVLSGGASNQDQFASLGGDPSSYPVPSGPNNLFENVSADDQQDGRVDYMCFYVFNNSFTETLWNADVAIADEIPDGADMAVGFALNDETQRLTVVGTVTGGSLTLTYDGDNFSFNYNADLGVWASNFQTAIRTVDGLEDVTVTGAVGVGPATTVFTIIFAGTAGKRFHPVLSVITNALTPSATITAARVVSGSPINAIAPLTDSPTTEPSGVIFYNPTESSPLAIGHLRPTEGFPIWVRRTTEAGSSALALDGGAVVVSGTAFE